MFETSREEQIDLLAKLTLVGRDLNCQLYAVGGVVRDLLMNIEESPKDWDFVVVPFSDRTAIQFADEANSKFLGKVTRYSQFQTAKIEFDNLYNSISEIDFTTARAETYATPGVLPQVEVVSDILLDLARRDFTINSIAVKAENLLSWMQAGRGIEVLAETILDPYGGLTDLKNRQLKVLHKESFIDDPTRIFRACRYLKRLELTIAPETEGLIYSAIDEKVLDLVDSHRISAEFREVFREKNPGSIISELNRFGVFNHVPLLNCKKIEISLDYIEKLYSLGLQESFDNYRVVLLLCFHSLADEKLTEAFQYFGIKGKRATIWRELLTDAEKIDYEILEPAELLYLLVIM